jgi:hypothetical protein
MKNPKQKGSSFERLISKRLTLWLTGQDGEYFFYRSPSSGGIATVNPLNDDITGDIIAIKPEARLITSMFSIECKDGYKDIDVLKIFKDNKNDILRDFWHQCMNDANKSKKHGMLIFRKKGYPILIGIESELDISKILENKIKKFISISFNNDLPKISIFELETFLSYLTKEMLT